MCCGFHLNTVFLFCATEWHQRKRQNESHLISVWRANDPCRLHQRRVRRKQHKRISARHLFVAYDGALGTRVDHWSDTFDYALAQHCTHDRTRVPLPYAFPKPCTRDCSGFSFTFYAVTEPFTSDCTRFSYTLGFSSFAKLEVIAQRSFWFLISPIDTMISISQGLNPWSKHRGGTRGDEPPSDVNS